MTRDRQRVAIIGAGWAGLAGATELQLAGHDVTVFESARQAGGRARRVDAPAAPCADEPGFAAPLDNGQHLLLGAYDQTLALMRRLGVNAEDALLRLPLQLCSASGHFSLRAPRLPAPGHVMVALLTARGLGWAGKLAAIRLMRHLRRMAYRTPPGQTVADLLRATRQRPDVTRLLWEPLCLAALNTPLSHACAQMFAAVLRDSLDGKARDSDLLVPRVDLTALWPQAATRHCWMRYGHPVRSIEPQPLQQTVRVDGEAFDRVLLAVPPYAAARLLPEHHDWHALRRDLLAFEYLPIATLTLQLAGPYPLPLPMMMLTEDRSRGFDGQWVFDRTRLLGLDARRAELTVVVSAASALAERPRPQAIRALLAQLAEQLPAHAHGAGALPEVLSTELIVEKRATFVVTPGLVRPANRTPHPLIWLAGDWTDTGYPATLEGAVRSGLQAARAMMRQG